VVAAGANMAGVRRPWAFGIIGLALWATVLASGVHATVAGVLLAMAIPVRTRIDEGAFLSEARRSLDEFDEAANVTANDPDVSVLTNSAHHTSIEALETLCEQVQPPLIRFEHALHGIVAFVIMPVFALANAGVTLDGGAIAGAATNPVTLGVILGLAVGKPLGITLFSMAAMRLGLTTAPAGVTTRMVLGAGILGGIGFTMALFIGGLAFESAELLDAAKIGVLAASLLTGVAGWLLLRGAIATRPAPEEAVPTGDLSPDGAASG
jgi:NhaA family Na+:H+ antiporter